jgi:hypothetical protein
VVEVSSTSLFTFPTDEAPVTLTALVRGSDGAPYVLDAASKTVWRIDRAKQTATAIARSGQKATGGTMADPAFLTIGGPDVLILDAKNQLWRWRPTNTAGKGTLRRVPVVDSASWGNDIRGIATFVANFDAAFYKLYIVDPSEQNIMVLSPANDGTGYPIAPTGRLPTDRPVDGITDLLIDGDIFVAEDGEVARVIPAAGWQASPPGDTLLRPTSNYVWLASPNKPDGSSSRRAGALYAFDSINHRLVAFSKATGDYIAQYRPAAGTEPWTDLRGMVVLPGLDDSAPTTLWWISATGLHSSVLEPAAPDGGPSASPGASASPSTDASPGTSSRATAKPTAKP